MENRMEQLREECLQCQKCPLAATRHHVVFGTGKTDAEVVFVGEGPGENEDLQGEPFVGRGGALLDKYLEAVDLSRERNIYIANIVKCRPPQNRDPKPEETACCIGYLSRQLVTRQHGEWFNKDGVWYMGTFHPAALLRNPHNKPDAFEDMLALQSKIREICTHTYDGTEL